MHSTTQNHSLSVSNVFWPLDFLNMLPSLEAPELFFGLCSPIGTDHDKIRQILIRTLKQYNYACEIIKISTIMRQVEIPRHNPVESPLDKRYDTLIKYANAIRELYDDPSALATLACLAIKQFRRKTSNKADAYLPNQAYVLDQFKRPEEIETLRQIYGRLFILISIYSDKQPRCKLLTEKIAHDYGAARPTAEHETKAKALMARDEDEEGQRHGQQLRDTFATADLFINVDDPTEAETVLTKFLRGFFGANDISPTRDEYGMYIAKAASLRSLDLSRQVGAAIFTSRGEVIALGCNEVPKPGGGTYWVGDPKDARDYVIGRDENERIKKALIVDVVSRLIQLGKIKTNEGEAAIAAEIMEEATKKGSLLRDALVMDLLEFGRIIHAEMSALADAARLGRSILDSVLFCTTFPCHICAKHIVAAGVRKVVFIEPYPKSYAQQLTSSIVVTVDERIDGTEIQFSPFIGISPVRFRDVFERGRRKGSDGKFQEWNDGQPWPVTKLPVAAYLLNEKAAIQAFDRRTRILKKDGKLSIKQAK